MKPDAIRFSFDGRAMTARPGQSRAAALTEAGQRVFRHTAKGADRGMFCGMGVCQDCLLTVDGAPNKRACIPGVAGVMQARLFGAPSTVSKQS